MIVKTFVVITLLAIVLSLASALFALVKDRDHSERTAKALTVRITLSIALFVLLLAAFFTGMIEPHGLNPTRGASIGRAP
jgi:putative copper export protein